MGGEGGDRNAQDISLASTVPVTPTRITTQVTQDTLHTYGRKYKYISIRREKKSRFVTALDLT